MSHSSELPTPIDLATMEAEPLLRKSYIDSIKYAMFNTLRDWAFVEKDCRIYSTTEDFRDYPDNYQFDDLAFMSGTNLFVTYGGEFAMLEKMTDPRSVYTKWFYRFVSLEDLSTEDLKWSVEGIARPYLHEYHGRSQVARDCSREQVRIFNLSVRFLEPERVVETHRDHFKTSASSKLPICIAVVLAICAFAVALINASLGALSLTVMGVVVAVLFVGTIRSESRDQRAYKKFMAHQSNRR